MTLVTIYLHCAVLFASHPWVLVDRPPSFKDERNKQTKDIFDTDIMDKMLYQILLFRILTI